MQRLFAYSIACEEQGFLLAVPQGEGKHAVELIQAFRAAFFVQVDDHFAVRMGFETMTLIFKLLSELSVIVNLAVKREPHGLVFVGHRLLSCRGEIDNAEPLMPESDACGVGVLGYLALVVGPAVRESAPHAMHYFRIDFFSLSYVSVNATHRVLEKLCSLSVVEKVPNDLRQCLAACQLETKSRPRSSRRTFAEFPTSCSKCGRFFGFINTTK